MSPEILDSETTRSETTSLVPVEPNSNALTETTRKTDLDEVRQETDALIAAFQTRLQGELQLVTNLTRDAYLNAVRQARAAIEQEPFFAPDRMEQSLQEVQKQAERSWLVISGEMESIGVRVLDAAKTVWKELTSDRTSD